MGFVLPPKSQVGVLDPEVSGEGLKVIMSDGDQVPAFVSTVEPVFPDLSKVKSLARYFNRRDRHIFPAWLYHESGERRLVKNAEEAAALGVCYRATSPDERSRYGLQHVWDWKDDSPWRPAPQTKTAFDPADPANAGKNYIPTPANPAVAQNAMINALVPAVAAAVARELNAGGGPKAPAGVAADDWAEFLRFKAWQKTQDAVNEVRDAASTTDIGSDLLNDPQNDLLNKSAVDDERASWLAEAERKGVKVDGRWSLERLKTEVQKAA